MEACKERYLKWRRPVKNDCIGNIAIDCRNEIVGTSTIQV